MQAEELRVGNLVYRCYPDGNEVVMVEKISQSFVNGFGISACKGIPLTEEWLVNEFPEIAKRKHRTSIFELHGIKFEISNSGNVYLYRQNKHLPWVHKLQNLIYELTGIELKIKENGK